MYVVTVLRESLKFDIDEAIITSDRRKAEQAAKNSVPDAEGPGDSEPA
jgi:hypothetical protein